MENIQGAEHLPTHYWIRGKDANLVGEWRIEAVSDANIHIINDPHHFGYDVVAIPKSPELEANK